MWNNEWNVSIERWVHLLWWHLTWARARTPHRLFASRMGHHRMLRSGFGHKYFLHNRKDIRTISCECVWSVSWSHSPVDRLLFKLLLLLLWFGGWNVLNVARFGCKLSMSLRLCSKLEYDMTAAFWSSLRSAACTFSVFFTGRALLRCNTTIPIIMSRMIMITAPMAMPVPNPAPSCASLAASSQRGSSPLHLPSSIHLRRYGPIRLKFGTQWYSTEPP